MSYINKYLRNFKPYKVASHKVWNVSQEERNQLLKLDWNESTIQPSPKVKEAIYKLLDNNDFFNLYPSTYNKELYEKLSLYADLPVENVQYFGSSDSLHEYIAKMYISVGDPVIILGPSYDNFRLTSEVNGARVFFCECDSNFNYADNQLESQIESIEPSLVYICNPNNPTGHLYSKDYIEGLLNKYNDVIFLIDEAYYEFSGVTCSELVLKYDNILISRTMSKAFGLANFRFGYLLASENNIKYISSIRNPKNITTFAQTAATAVLSDIPYMLRFVAEVNKAKRYFIDEIKNMNGLIPYESGGNFVLIRCDSFELKMKLINNLENVGIFVRNVSQSPILKNCFRVSIGTMNQMFIVVEAIKKIING